nr:putative reverse transcriptase domain-containing protein [Tanacetum cinerariifolium]
MTKLTQKKVKFESGNKQEAAFQLLNQKLCSAPILALPEGSEDFIVYCDASNKWLGAVLMQREKRHGKGPSHRKDSNLSAEKGKGRSKQKERKAHHIGQRHQQLKKLTAGFKQKMGEPEKERLALGRAHTHEPTLSRIRAPVDSETAIVVNGSKAREREDKILAEAEKEEEKEERTATITSLDKLQLRPFVNEGIERPAKGSTSEFQDYETKSWD